MSEQNEKKKNSYLYQIWKDEQLLQINQKVLGNVMNIMYDLIQGRKLVEYWKKINRFPVDQHIILIGIYLS